MEGTVPEAKYQKLASEYAKLRAQAMVLKKAVIEEQAKSASLREQLRQHETSNRRIEQEVDSLGFRNKQLEHRVSALQEELAESEARKRDKEGKRGSRLDTQQVRVADAGDAVIFEELQKKIMENAQLTSLIDDKDRELQLHTEHIRNMEQTLEKRNTEHGELEKKLRREIETLQSRNSELETKLVEAASMLGSEDALSASGSDTTPLHNHQQQHQHHQQQQHTGLTSEERIACLEKEIAHWQSQYELSKLGYVNLNGVSESHKEEPSKGAIPVFDANCSCSTAAAGLAIKAGLSETKSNGVQESVKESSALPLKEQLLYNSLCKKFEELLRSKHCAQSRVSSYETEIDHLQNCLENATQELKSKDEQMQSINQALQLLEEDLATTRINYEEQISVLTEQVISLSEQLAACK